MQTQTETQSLTLDDQTIDAAPQRSLKVKLNSVSCFSHLQSCFFGRLSQVSVTGR